MTGEGLSAADIMAMTKDSNGSNGDWMNNPFIYLVWLALLGNGNLLGNRGTGNGGGGDGINCTDLFNGFNTQDVNGQLRGISQGICDGFYAANTGMLQGFNGVTQGLNTLGFQSQQGFCGVENTIMQSNFNTQTGFNNLSSQLANCCCENREAIANVRYDMAAQACDTRNLIQNVTRDMIDNNNNNTRSILDFLVQDKLATLQAENADLRRAASQDRQNALLTTAMTQQTAQLIQAIKPPVVPAYIVPNPNIGVAPYGYDCGSCAC